MLEAFGLGTLAQSSLLFAGLLVCWVTVPRRLIGILAGFGAGALIAAVSFDLLAEAGGLGSWELALWMLVGVAIFLGGDWIVERRFGNERAGGAMGIVVGSVVDGVPESIIFGIQIATDFPVSISFVAAVFVSNIPQRWRRRPTSLRRAGARVVSERCGCLSSLPAVSPRRWATWQRTQAALRTVTGWQRSPRVVSSPC